MALHEIVFVGSRTADLTLRVRLAVNGSQAQATFELHDDNDPQLRRLVPCQPGATGSDVKWLFPAAALAAISGSVDSLYLDITNGTLSVNTVVVFASATQGGAPLPAYNNGIQLPMTNGEALLGTLGKAEHGNSGISLMLTNNAQ